MTTRVNLCFHGIGAPNRVLEDGEHDYWISEDFFDQILNYVAVRQSVRISFDDGNASDQEIALPALHKRGLSAQFFPIARRLGQSGSLERSGLRELVRHGMTIGSHGMDHREWRGLDRMRLDDELIEARRLISAESGVAVNLASCPLGSYDRRVLRMLRKLKYAQVLTSDRSVARPGAWLQPRYSVRNSDTFADVVYLIDGPHRPVLRAISAARITIKRLR